ncbi:hypothetical protein GCM10010328_50280 [Streptomyces rubiginosohelvolus]|uniref:Uncharacterized protein n=1 Tax=Streptomyces rubiginosohelvolus TaxID=67362 RepID=A0ABQ3C8F6_9ACTN|nr:hypothetical protein GCM10010328_50280 [Streptomyces pluricolorescens]
MSTRAAGGAEGPAGEDGAADEGAAEAATVPADAAAPSAAVRTVLREVGLVMVVTPGRMRKVVCGCRAVRCGGDAVRFANYPGSGADRASGSAVAAEPIWVWTTGMTCGGSPVPACRNVPWGHGRPGPPRR